MDKLIKKDLLLEKTEIEYIAHSILNKAPFDVKKIVEMDIDNERYKVELSFYRVDTVEDIKLEIKFTPYNVAVDGFKFEEEYSLYDNDSYPLIGVKKIQFKGFKTKEEIKLLLNINLDKNSYKTINEYEKEMFNIYCLSYSERFKILEELEYYDFEDKFNILLCSYLLIRGKKARVFDTSSKVFKLYEDKLYFAGIDLEDYKDDKYNFGKKVFVNIDKDISLKNNREELIDYFFNYIAYLIYCSDKITLTIIGIDSILNMIFYKYISLRK